jgi:hypothetical protein
VRRRVVFLGVGGVGKTTLVYRLIGLSVAPHATVCPGLYRLYFINGTVELLDVPGLHATEAAQHAAGQMRQFFDKAVLMYDVTRSETLYALSEILDSLCIYRSCLSARGFWWWAISGILPRSWATWWRTASSLTLLSTSVRSEILRRSWPGSWLDAACWMSFIRIVILTGTYPQGLAHRHNYTC